MKLLSKLKIPKSMMIGIVIAAVLIIGIAIVVKISSDKEQDITTYDYNAVEQQLADEVAVFLNNHIELQKNAVAEIANAAVENYRIIVNSDVDIVNDDHTAAIERRIRSAMIALIDDAALLTDDNLDGLSSGVAEIIWDIILGQIETTESDYKQEYLYLSESIQDQINQLEQRKMKVSIQANIKNNEADLSAEELLELVHGMTDRELEELANSLGISLEELKALISSQINANNTELNTELKETLEKLKEEIRKEILREMQTKYGNIKDGKDGADGANGQSGKDGKDGKDGKNGKTTYIAYADDMFGTGFSITPTETTKYVGTCITTKSIQPTDYAEYSNWQEYRAYIITTTVDENNVTTVHIN